MSQSRLTINIQCQYVLDWGKTLDFLRKLQPYAVVACIDNMNAKNRVYELQQALPQTKVIARFVFGNDGGMHLKPQAAGDNRQYIVSPTDAMNAWGELGTDGRILYLLNEPMANGASQEDIGRLVDWSLEAARIALQRNISLCLINFGVGHPMLLGNGEYDARFDELLKLLSQYRDKLALGMHVYQPADTFTRIDGLIKRCKSLGITPPRVHFTEAGFDVASGGDSLNGYKSRGYTGKQFADFLIDKLKNVYSSYIADDVLQSIAVFCWGNDVSWKSFNVENDSEWQATIQEAKDKGLLSVGVKQPAQPPIDKPEYTPQPFSVGHKYVLQSEGGARTNVRKSPKIVADNVITSIEDKTVVTLYEETIVGVDYWRRISTDTISDGWISLRGNGITFSPYLGEVVTTPPPATTYTVTLTADEYAAWTAFRQAMERAATQTVTVTVRAA